MTPNHEEDNITAAIAAIDRNTAAIQSHRDWTFAVMMVLVLFLGILLTALSAKATPLLPPLSYEIGKPPSPPPNPNLQYWYTMDVPGPQGVLPQEVFAPRLVAQVASDAAVVDVPEPGTWILLGTIIFLMAVGSHACRRRTKMEKMAFRHGLALVDIKWYGDKYSRNIARKALEESKQ